MTGVAQIRAFNRIVAERIGALNDQFLGRDRPYGESRVLWEIGRDGVEIRELRERLGLDSGYMSRVIRALKAAGLIKVDANPQDGRVRRLRLTPAGWRERAELDRRSDDLARSFLEPLGKGQRAALVSAMDTVVRLLAPSMVEFAVEDPGSRDARWCLNQYFKELNSRFETGFDPARGISASPHELVAPAGAFVIGRLRGRPIACGALKFHGPEPAELKRMWVAPESRGAGLGRRLLRELERVAREGGARVVRLETNRSLREAIALYRAAGYREVRPFNQEPYAHHWFEKRL
jgi:DNA-binding MarR family transcriptional regulator/GNAT superfamily N-acetyltransferase